MPLLSQDRPSYVENSQASAALLGICTSCFLSQKLGEKLVEGLPKKKMFFALKILPNFLRLLTYH